MAAYKNLRQHLERGDDLIPNSKNDAESLLAELNHQPCTSFDLPKSPPKAVGNELDSKPAEISDKVNSVKGETSGPKKPTVKEWFELIEANEKRKRDYDSRNDIQ